MTTGCCSGTCTMDWSESEYKEHGHFFSKKTFHRPTYCHHCTDLLWGLIGQGYICEVCNFVVHDRCMRSVVTPCSSRATSLIINPVPHCWSESTQFKKKFCNLCRKKLDDSNAVRCEICEYYAHVECQDFAVSDCKDCSTYIPQPAEKQMQHHHWREGNLAANSKCQLCKKTCWSAECLTGMRCEWCGLVAHATCFRQLPLECSYGILREILLPPYALSVPSIDVPQETLFNLQIKKPTLTMDEMSSGSDTKPEEQIERRLREKDSSGEPKESKEMKEKDDAIIRIYDGNLSYKRHISRTISIPRTTSVKNLLIMALRTFHMTDDPSGFYLNQIVTNDSTDVELELNQSLINQLLLPTGKRPSLMLRSKESDSNQGIMRIFVFGISNSNSRTQALSIEVSVTRDTTVAETVKHILPKCGLEKADIKKYCLVEVSLDRGVAERQLNDTDRPWLLLQAHRTESLRLSRCIRYCVQPREDPNDIHIAIYVGNLPASLSERQYEHILLDIVHENKWSKMDVIYYEYGSLVLIYNNSTCAAQALELLQNASYDEKPLLVLLLPNIQPSLIDSSVTPLLVLVNVKSGGQQGMELIKAFRKLLNPHQVYDLMNGGPLPGLYVFRTMPAFKILVCGGDGSVGWALSCLDNVGQDALCQYPPMAILPLGTGNDLARVLRWGSGCTGGEDPLSLLRDVIEADEIKLDRWTVIYHPNEVEQDEAKLAISIDTNTAPPNEDTTSIFVMNNYFGIGIDADLCLDFHTAREENPDKFNNRMYNKTVYFRLGLHKIIGGSAIDLRKMIRLEVDGKVVDLPPIEGIIILNILSWASGCNPWGVDQDDKFSRPTHCDGLLEIVGISGVVHMGQMQGGLRSGMRIAQGSHVKILLFDEMPVQVDGEPRTWPAGQVVVLRSALTATMLKKSKSKVKRHNTDGSGAAGRSSGNPQPSTSDMDVVSVSSATA